MDISEIGFSPMKSLESAHSPAEVVRSLAFSARGGCKRHKLLRRTTVF